MTRDFTQQIDAASSGGDVGLLVTTRNYRVGEIVTVVVGEEREGLSAGERSFSGAVDAAGKVRMLVDTSESGEPTAAAKVR